MPDRRIPSDLESLGSLYRSTLASRRVLIVLDNARDAAHEIVAQRLDDGRVKDEPDAVSELIERARLPIAVSIVVARVAAHAGR